MAEWEFTFMCSWSQVEPVNFPDGKAIIADLKQRAQSLSQPFCGFFEAIDDEERAWANHLPYWPTQRWEGHPARGKVTLAGDAAHPMTPHRGQGLNNAILDCRDFVKAVEAMPGRTGEALRAAVARYEESMWERGHYAVMSSLENSVAVHDWAMLMDSPLMREGVAKQKAARMEATEEGGGEKRAGTETSP